MKILEWAISKTKNLFYLLKFVDYKNNILYLDWE